MTTKEHFISYSDYHADHYIKGSSICDIVFETNKGKFTFQHMKDYDHVCPLFIYPTHVDNPYDKNACPFTGTGREVYFITYPNSPEYMKRCTYGIPLPDAVRDARFINSSIMKLRGGTERDVLFKYLQLKYPDIELLECNSNRASIDTINKKFKQLCLLFSKQSMIMEEIKSDIMHLK